MGRRLLKVLVAVGQVFLGIAVSPILLVGAVVVAPFCGAFILGRAVVEHAMEKLKRQRCDDCPRYPRSAEIRIDWGDRAAVGGYPNVCRRCAERRGIPALAEELN